MGIIKFISKDADELTINYLGYGKATQKKS